MMQQDGDIQAATNNRVLSLQEAASFLRLHPNTLLNKVNRGLIPGGKIGRAWRFLEADLIAVIRGGYKLPLTHPRNSEDAVYSPHAHVEPPLPQTRTEDVLDALIEKGLARGRNAPRG